MRKQPPVHPDHAPLAIAAARRHEVTRARAIQARRELDRAGAPVTFAAVAAAALLTELLNVSAAQVGCTLQQPTTGMSERSESPGRRGPVVSPIATETGHTRLNRSPAFSSLPISGVNCSTS